MLDPNEIRYILISKKYAKKVANYVFLLLFWFPKPDKKRVNYVLLLAYREL